MTAIAMKYFVKRAVVSFFLFSSLFCCIGQAQLPSGWSQGDIGSVGVTGSGSYANGTFTVQGAGAQIYGSSDAFHFVYQSLSGDWVIVARIVSVTGSANYGAAGVMIRETLDAAARNAKTADWPAYGFYFDLRTTPGGGTSEPGSVSVAAPYWVKVSRSGSNVSSYVSANGASWTQLGSTQTMSMAQNVYVGLAVTSGSTSSAATAAFDNVSISPAPPPAPSITSLSPTSGALGASLTITGTNFGSTQGSSTVTIGGAAAAVNSWSATSITAAVPAGLAAGNNNVVVTVSNVASNGVAFTVNAPSISSLSPTGGAPGTLVTISGNNFGPYAGSVTFNGAATTVYSWSNTSIQAYVPGELSTGNIVVNDGGLQSNGVLFTAAPIITSLSPPSGEAGTSVTIAGTNFTSTTGSVTFTGYQNTTVTASISSWSSNQIVVTVPVGTITGQVKVTAGSVTSNTNMSFVVPPPHVSSVSPTSGTGGTQVTIAGSGFQSTRPPSNTSVAIGGATATVSSWSDTQIVATVATNAFTGPVSITVNGIASNQDVLFSTPNPTITGLNPSSAPVGTQVQVNGSGFGATQGSSTITFNGAQITPTSWSDTQIVVTIPSNQTSGSVAVHMGSILSNTNIVFTVPAPVITSISPTSGTVGTQVTISGSGFQASRGYGSVAFNNVTASGIVSWSDTQIVVNVPNGASTGGVGVAANNYQWSNHDVEFTMPNPTITGITPTTGPVSTQATVSGYGFGATQGSSTLTFNSQTATSIVSWSDSQIVAAVPASATSGSVKVTNGGVPSNTNIYFTVPAPHITSISPTSGGVGTQVTINGSGFQAARGSGYLGLGNMSATATSWSDTQIVAPVPNGAYTGPVQVTANDGVASNSDIVFTMPNPVITGFSPIAGAVGAQVLINGSGFGATQGSSNVSFWYQNSATVVSWSDTQITVTVPSGAANGPIRVTEGGVGAQSSVYFTPGTVNIASLSPTAGPTGTQVTVTGSGFGSTQGSSTITFNGVAASSITGWTDSQIVATVPSTAISGAVKVVNGGTASNTNFSFTVDNVVVTGITPSSGVAGAQIQISGSGFGATQGSSTLTLNGYSATVSAWSNTQITASVPTYATTGPVKVTVGGVASNQDIVFTVPSPVITGLSPSSGPAGTQVTVSGSGFGASQNSGTITFYNAQTATVSSWSDNQIVASVPPNATSGYVRVVIGSVASNTNLNFTVPTPQVNSISPVSGVVGTQVTVSGTHFGTGAGSVYFNGGSTSSFVSWNDTQIVVNVPAASSSGGVTVYSHIGQASNSDVVFTMPNPTITSVTPSSAATGTQVTISGSGFGATQGTSTLAFAPNGNVSGTPTSWSDTQIVATVPATAASGFIKITEGGVASNTNINLTVPPPQVTSLSPSYGVVGTQVTVNGSGFGATQGSSIIYFNNTQPTVNSWSATQIVVTVASNTTAGPVKIYVSSGSSNQDVVFNMPNPVITSITPSSGTLGTTVQINGRGFGATQGSSVMSFRGTSANATVTSWSDTQITVTVPSNAVTGAATVTVSGVASNGVNFTFTPPQITSISPNTGGVGSTVTITGSGFLPTQTSGYGSGNAYFGGVTAPITSWSGTQIVAAVPSGASTAPVTVTVQGQTSNPVNFTLPNNVVNWVSPAVGPVGTQVTVNGVGFGSTQGTSSLTFNGQTASVSSWSDGQIAASVPVTSASGPAVVTVNGVPSNNTVVFSVPAPRVTSLSPYGGIVGTTITIGGSGFQANQRNSTLTFNGVAATVSSWSDTQIVANVPTSATTGP
ncbi:MAG TPA: IPT/TIG domain-containing protein, partial [Candidatus Angelobacter sp.]